MKQSMKFSLTLLLGLIIFASSPKSNDQSISNAQVPFYNENFNRPYHLFILKMSNEIKNDIIESGTDSLMSLFVKIRDSIAIKVDVICGSDHFIEYRFPDCQLAIDFFLNSLMHERYNEVNDIKIDDTRFDVELYPQSKRPNYVSLDEIKSAHHYANK